MPDPLPVCPALFLGSEEVMRVWIRYVLVLCHLRATIRLAAFKPRSEKSPGRCLKAAVLMPGPPQQLAALFSGWSSVGTQGKDLLQPRLHPHGPPDRGRLLGRGQGTLYTTKQLSAVFPTSSSRKVVKVLKFKTLCFRRPWGRTVFCSAELSAVLSASPALGASGPP